MAAQATQQSTPVPYWCAAAGASRCSKYSWGPCARCQSEKGWRSAAISAAELLQRWRCLTRVACHMLDNRATDNTVKTASACNQRGGVKQRKPSPLHVLGYGVEPAFQTQHDMIVTLSPCLPVASITCHPPPRNAPMVRINDSVTLTPVVL